MKKLALLAIACATFATSCGDISNNISIGGPERPYTIAAYDFGYSVTYDEKKGFVYTVPQVRAELYSAAGAPDVNRIEFKATLLDGDGNPVTKGVEDTVITPVGGTLFGGAKGGYVCTSTSASYCQANSPDAILTDAGPLYWRQNGVERYITQIEWAVAHNEKYNDPAGWSIDIEYTAYQSTGGVVTWKDNYEFVSPAGD